MTHTPLRRNRDFMLLQAGQLLSTAGTSVSGIAFPLLVLGVTHSPAKAGLVQAARFMPLVATFRYPQHHASVSSVRSS